MTTERATAPVPEELSRSQLFAMLGVVGIITEHEAEEAAPGQLPHAFAAFVETLPAEQQFSAAMLLRENIVFRRHHPTVEKFFARHSVSDQQADDLWRAGARR